MTEHERLDLNAKHWWLFGRERELAILDGALERASSGSRELVFVAGPSGMGKASIAEYLNHGQKCLFTRGKFDAVPNAPFAAIISVCVELITITCRDKLLKEKVSNSMSHEMTDADLSSLLTFLPTFQDLLDDRNRSFRVAALSQAQAKIAHKKDLLTKIKFAVRSFLRIITRHSSCPLILCLQDLQWADATSMDLLEFIAEDRDQKRFIIAVTYSAEDTDIGRRAQKWVKRVSSGETQRTTVSNIYVDLLVLEQLNRLLSVVMKMREEETMPLAVHLMPLTAGNLFAALQLMEQWENQGMLTYNGSTSNWQWDLEKSKDIAVSEGLVDMLSNRIRRLPSNVQRVLQLSACLGYRFEPSFLEAIKEALPGDLLDVKSILQFCFDESLLEPQGDGRVMFLHKTIHEGALLRLPQGDELETLHMRIGILLWHHLKRTQTSHDRTLFLCVDYLIMGSNHIEDDIMMLELAELCNEVGNKALDLSAFVVAADYFKKGIELLNKICCSKWEDFHELTESMFVSFAEVQYYNGKFGECVKAIQELLANNPSESARMCANLTRLQILKDKGNLKKFVVSSLVFLKELGVTFPSRFMMERARLLRSAVMKKLNGMHDTTIMNLPRVSDLNTITVMKVLNLMTVAVIELGLVHLCAMTLHKAVLLSLTHGLSDSSPGAFVLLGAYLISEKGMLLEGYRMGQLAINMSQELDSSTVDGFVAYWVHGMTGLWQRTTLAERLPPLLQGHQVALKNGDPFSTFMSINQYVTISFFRSKNLCLLLEDMEKFSTQMLEYGQKAIFLQMLPLWQCILNLSGRSHDPLDMAHGEAMSKQDLVGNDHDISEETCWSFLMQLAFYMGDFELASSLSAKLQSVNIGFMKSHVLYQARVFFMGLIAIEHARSTGKPKFKKEAAKHLSVMRRWVEKKAANVVHKFLILEAEYDSLFVKHSSRNKNKTVGRTSLHAKYDDAIAASVKSDFMQDAALAAQLAGRALFRAKDTAPLAESYFAMSHGMWEYWGAFAVSNCLGAKLMKDFPGINLDASASYSRSHGLCFSDTLALDSESNHEKTRSHRSNSNQWNADDSETMALEYGVS